MQSQFQRSIWFYFLTFTVNNVSRVYLLVKNVLENVLFFSYPFFCIEIQTMLVCSFYFHFAVVVPAFI